MLRRNRLILLCSALVVFLALPEANARTSRRRKSTAFTVALQPFSLVHSAVHTVAAPVVNQAPRVLRAAAVAPVKLAFQVPRAVARAIPRAEPVDDYDQDYGDETSGPIRVAYQVQRGTPVATPHDSADEYDQDHELDQEPDEDQAYEEPQIERRGDRPTVAGSRAVLRNGIAYAPSRAPERVKNAIWAANALRRKPYVWGGGHGSFNDYGYDCSGSVSYALRGAGLLSAPLPSTDFLRYGERGRGRWITIYSRPGHTFAVIAGLRFDTTDMGHGGNVGPRWYMEGRNLRGFQARHPAGF